MSEKRTRSARSKWGCAGGLVLFAVGVVSALRSCVSSDAGMNFGAGLLLLGAIVAIACATCLVRNSGPRV
jgi:hypothetical protein